MEERLPLMRINIPDAPPAARQAADIMIAAVREAGLDPRKAVDNPMIQSLAISWRNGETDRAGFINGCRNMGIFNPSLLASVR